MTTRDNDLERRIGKHRVYPVLSQLWIKSERGQDTRYCSIHRTHEDRDAYIKEYWDEMPTTTPETYIRPRGETMEIPVDEKTYRRLERSRNGIRI